ncbi:MAG: hypothetical protein IAI48_06200 [Candidatus Eremiobacteraeota bacterium]|nr:hypothetical protein [Candidatus Eremiobacteraeota bacterium]
MHRTVRLRYASLALAASIFAAPAGRASAQAPAAQPSAAASPSASATPRPLGLHASLDASLTSIDQSTRGPGQIGPEASGFIAGAPLAPNTPYDLFSSAPQTPGFAGIGQAIATAAYGFRTFDATITGGFGDVDGSVTNAAYWGESLFPALNPHLGAQALPYRIAFPAHAGEDDGRTFRASLLGATLASADGNVRVRGGYFDLAQTDRFAFAQPALTSVNPAIGFATPETLGNGAPALDDWSPVATQLPLDGFDLVAKRGDGTLEVTTAALPSLPGESARLDMGSLVSDRGEGTRFSADLVHVATSGLPFVTTVPFGANPTYDVTPQGVLPTSTLDGQRQTIAAGRGAFHISTAYALDGTVEIGRTWYDASAPARPGTARPGGYYHAGLTKTKGRVTASLDVYRMEARYAPIILPYGVPENQWSAAFAWPGQWLKSNYQSIDNTVLGVNRQGYRLRYFVDKGPLEVHLEYVDLRQISPETTATAEQTGFVDGYYLPQAPAAATFGRQRRYGFWAAWHPAFGDVTLDVVDDTLNRPTGAGHPLDGVSYEVPQAILTVDRHVSPNVIASVGLGRYAMDGRFSEPIDFAERSFVAGAEVRETPRASVLVSFRRSAFAGVSTFPAAGTSPDFTGSLLVIEQRLHL